MSVPIIGITTGGNREERRKDYTSYAEAIELAGGRPKYLDPKPVTPEALAEDLDSIDGLLLAGGKDVHPKSYNARNEPGDEKMSVPELLAAYGMTCDEARDAYEIPLARIAYCVRLPILGVCRGFQLLNVALGGTLIKDIRTNPKHWAFREGESKSRKPGESRSHKISIVPDSRLIKILGGTPQKVNSRHHQGITEKEKSGNLRAVALAPDGIVEAVESQEQPWVFAVQWHPERAADGYVYDPCKVMFSAFVAAAKNGR